MNAEEDTSLDEKRVYGTKEGTIPVFVATGSGLARVEISDDFVGEFSLAYRGDVRDVACTTAPPRDARTGDDSRSGDGPDLAVATPGDVLVGEAFESTEFGPATAVGFEEGLIAAGDGRIAEWDSGVWTGLGLVDDVRALSGEMVAAAEGVFRVDGTRVGLSDVRDVSTGREVYAATGDGLYRLGNGWLKEASGGFRAVAGETRASRNARTGERTSGERAVDRAYAVTDDGDLLEKEAGAWDAVGTPADDVADVALGRAVYAVTTDGTVLVEAGDGWRDRALGLSDARRLAVP